ncbi:DUF6588 family protein [Spirobacillus cienkowskii]|uniref:DUF6588 family protein n=1 Tax=Spirobacillus cienkowskii TaxID=495820 RepID=UPI0030CED838
MKLYFKFILILNLFFYNTSFAKSIDINFTSQISDDDYKKVVESVINPTRFQFIEAPSSTTKKLIALSFSAGVGISLVSIPQSTIDAINANTNLSNNFPNSLLIPRIIAKVGLPGNFDLAINYAKIPDNPISISGIGIQYGFYNPRLLPISLSIRGGYTQLTGFSELTANTKSLEGLIGIYIPFIKPYAGIGNNWSKSNTEISKTISNQSFNLTKSAEWSQFYSTVGIQFISIIGIALEAQFSSNQTLYNAKLSLEI